MKTRNFLWGFLASMFLVGCSQNEDVPGGGNEKDGKEWSYMAVNVNAAPSAGSRTENEFVAGDANESAVTNACFFFFNASGEPFSVTGDGYDYVPEQGQGGNDATTGQGNNTASPGGGNWVIYNYDNQGSGSGTTNVEKQLPVVLTLKGIKNDYPAKMVAVLNWAPSQPGKTSYKLTDLQEILLTSHVNSGSFIMSNSVYNNGTEDIYATKLTQTNFATTPEKAIEYPVEIYIERVAAKVTVNVDENKVVAGQNNLIKVGKDSSSELMVSLGGTDNKKVYARIDGWDLNTTIEQSYLLKNITDKTGFYNGWSDPTNYRSYWANIPTAVDYNSSFTYAGIDNELAASDYCLENTSQAEKKTTKVVVKATICEEKEVEGNKKYEPLPLAYWMGTYYRLDDLTNIVADALSLSKQLYYRLNEEENWKLINTKDGDNIPGLKYIGMEEISGSYKVTFKYVPDGTAIQWSFDGVTALEGEEGKSVAVKVDEKLKSLAPAQVWKNGQTYYSVPIKHADVNSSALYGVIRNHVYQINITGVIGLGTPVFNGNSNIEEPLVPMETDTYLAARINVLSWKVVSNDVILGQ